MGDLAWWLFSNSGGFIHELMCIATENIKVEEASSTIPTTACDAFLEDADWHRLQSKSKKVTLQATGDVEFRVHGAMLNYLHWVVPLFRPPR